jgi:hypothetical protein
MTFRSKILATGLFSTLTFVWLAPAWGQLDNPNSDLPPYDSKATPGGTVQADFSTDGSLKVNAYPRRTSYAEDPSGRMIDNLQQENNPNYYPSTDMPGVPQIVDPNYPSNKASRKVSSDVERLPGGTTRVLQPSDMLTPDGQAVNNIGFQSGGAPVNPMGMEGPFSFNESWTWQVLPDSILYKSYLAGNHESRMGTQLVHINNVGNYWDATIGGRVGILRYGNTDPYEPQGYQLDIEGAAFPRLKLNQERDLDMVDFRAGVPLTMRRGAWQTKFGYYHLSSHLGDEYMVSNNTLNRINYVRESLMFGVGLFLNPNFRVYSEVDYAFYTDGGAEPWEFQFGAEFSPVDWDRHRGSPFIAVHGHLHQEVDFGGSITAQIGWQWRGRSGRLLRTGFQYFNGMSEAAQVYDQFEAQYGWGMWYDF